jgi:hypothetical protein
MAATTRRKSPEPLPPARQVRRANPRAPAQRYPVAEPENSFLFTHNPAAWHVLDGRVLPRLGQITLQSGAGGVYLMGDGTFNVDRAERQAFARGDQIIDPDPDDPYCVPIKVQDATGRESISYLAKWARWPVGATAPVVDTKAYADWVESLVTSGQNSPPERWAVIELRDRLEATLALQAESARPNARAVAKLTADIAAVDRYLEEGE